MTGDILDLIDAAVEDWETSGDAMRWMPDAPKSTKRSGVVFSQPRLYVNDVEVPVISFELQQPRLSLGMLGFAADFERQVAALSQEERDGFTAYWQASPWSFERAFYAWSARRTMEPVRVAMGVWVEQLAMVLRGAQESVAQLARVFRLDPWPHGWDGPCSCHPAPFPAARDYRRRTKHRNRRRRRQ